MVTVEETIEYTKEWIQNVESSMFDLRHQLTQDLLSVWPVRKGHMEDLSLEDLIQYWQDNYPSLVFKH